MIDPDVARAQAEQAKGEEYERVFDSYINPFLVEKRKILFDAFQEVPLNQVDMLKDIKAQLTAINSLEAHFKQFITTGKLAKIELEK